MKLASRRPAAAYPEAPALPAGESPKFNYQRELYRLYGMGAVKGALLLLMASLVLAVDLLFYGNTQDLSVAGTVISAPFLVGFGLLLFWAANLLSERLIGERTCYPMLSRFWSYETSAWIQELHARKRSGEIA